MTQVKVAAEIAIHFPRDEARATNNLLAACSDPEFADEAIYSVKRGNIYDKEKGEWVENMAEGFSIRFAEEAARCWKHFQNFAMTVHEDDEFRRISLTVWDCEANNSYTDPISIPKIIERRNADGREVVYQRPNSDNKVVFGVRPTPDELTEAQNRAMSKSIRNLQLRHIPSHVKKQCWSKCNETLLAEVNKDKNKATDKIVAEFKALRPPVAWEKLAIILGIETTAVPTAEQVVQLRTIYRAIKSKEKKIDDFMPGADDHKDAPAGDQPDPPKVTKAAATNTGHGQKIEGGNKMGQVADMLLILGGQDANKASEIGETIRMRLNMPKEEDMAPLQVEAYYKAVLEKFQATTSAK